MQSDLSLALRCVDLVLALDDALQVENARSAGASSEAPHAVLDLGRLVAQGLFEEGRRYGMFIREGLSPLRYELTRPGGGGYTLSVWAGSERTDLSIVTTQPRFGGDRYWFLCASQEHAGDRRARHLYLDG